MGNINIQDLKNDIKKETFSKVYYFYGKEKYLLNHYSNLLCETVHKNLFKEFNFNKLTKDVSVQDMANAVEALPMMAERKCVLVEDWDIQNLSQSEFNKLKELLSDLPDTTVLVFKDTKELKKVPAVRKVIKLFENSGSVLEFKEMARADIAKQLIKWAKLRNCDLRLSDANFLIDYSSDDLFTLKNELEKLCAYCEEKATIEKSDIENLVIKSIDSSVFTMSNAVCNGDFDTALLELDKLIFQKEEPIMILAVLASSFVDMYRVKLAKIYKISDAELASTFEYSANKAFKLKAAHRNSSKFAMKDIEKIINLFSDTDIKLKSEKGDARTYIEQLLSEIILILKSKK